MDASTKAKEGGGHKLKTSFLGSNLRKGARKGDAQERDWGREGKKRETSISLYGRGKEGRGRVKLVTTLLQRNRRDNLKGGRTGKGEGGSLSRKNKKGGGGGEKVLPLSVV